MTRELRAGDLVEVCSAEEILATLDERGRLDSLPFMPEMVQYCGRRFRVGRRADKTCDTIGAAASRRMLETVHLEDLRCDGSGHDGCQAQCLLFWKEAWLRRVSDDREAPPDSADTEASERAEVRAREVLEEHARLPPSAPGRPGRWMCQATELQRATTAMAWWEPGQYWRELRSGNVSLRTFLATVARAAFNVVQRRRGGMPRPCVIPRLQGPTPTERLDLQPGEPVRIKTQAEIEATLDRSQKNRGLYFDVEMLPYCGRTTRVKTRVRRIVEEETGELRTFSSDCLILEGVTCSGRLSHDRLFCPRAIHPWWREIWLERAEDGDQGPRPA